MIPRMHHCTTPSASRLSSLFLLLILCAPAIQGQVLNAAERGQSNVLTQPAPISASLPPLVFTEPLPTDPVAWLEGEAIPASQLLQTTLESNLGLITQQLIGNKKLELELEHRGITLKPEDVEDELKQMVERMAPGKSIEDLQVVGANSMKQLRRQAWANRGWKVLYWEQFNIPEDQRVTQMNVLVLTIIRRQLEPNYEVRQRGTEPAPEEAGALFSVKHMVSGKKVSVGASEALDFLMGLVKQGSLIAALDSMLDTKLVNRAMEQAGVSVTDLEIARYAASEEQKYAGTITPRASLLRLQGLTPDQDNERWRRRTAWERVAARSPELRRALPSPEILKKFLEENRSFFMHEQKRVSHILVRTTDEITNLPYDEKRLKAAQAKAELIYQKTMEGVEFAKLARLYSDDIMTARGDGRMSAWIQSRGGALDPAFRDAVWALDNIGDIHAPIKSSIGWHIIKLDEFKKPAKVMPDYSKGTYLDWLRLQYTTEQMQKWLKTLRAEADIKKVGQAELFKLKARTYYNPK